nr:copia protein [Tanacetum cinerariifolium]
SGPAWLFDIDGVSQTMNYHPVLAEKQTNSNAGFQDTKNAGEEGTQTYVLFPVLSDGSTNPKNKKDAHTNGKEHDDDIQKFITNVFSAAGPSNAAIPNLEDLSHNADDVGAEADINKIESIISVSPIPTTRIHKDHPTSQIIGDLSSTTQTRSMARAVRDQGHTQEEGIDYEEVFTPVARIKATRLFLAYASFMGFPVYQMDVKSAFLYGTIEEEVYVFRDVAEDAEARVPAQGDDVQEHAAEEVATNIVKLKARVKKLEKLNQVKSSKLRRLKKDEGIELVANQEKDAEVEGRHADKQAEIYNIDLDHSSKVVAASTPIPDAKPKTLTITAAPAVSTTRRKRVAAKRRKLSEEAQEADDLKKRLEIVQDADDDVFVEATPLAQKVPVVDYQ